MNVFLSHNVKTFLKHFIDKSLDYHYVGSKEYKPTSVECVAYYGKTVYEDYHINVGIHTILYRHYSADIILTDDGYMCIREMLAGNHFIVSFKTDTEISRVVKHRVFIRTTEEQAEEEIISLLLSC